MSDIEALHKLVAWNVAIGVCSHIISAPGQTSPVETTQREPTFPTRSESKKRNV